MSSACSPLGTSARSLSSETFSTDRKPQVREQSPPFSGPHRSDIYGKAIKANCGKIPLSAPIMVCPLVTHLFQTPEQYTCIVISNTGTGGIFCCINSHWGSLVKVGDNYGNCNDGHIGSLLTFPESGLLPQHLNPHLRDITSPPADSQQMPTKPSRNAHPEVHSAGQWRYKTYGTSKIAKNYS